ncbi:MAG TPA: PAS domain-containing sensor histidine kinase [Candidatus Saccharimonadales bacterium]|nr:PAS domain-containing sensor histidine kinase [Candidatus Saccharimonadales bacterium]
MSDIPQGNTPSFQKRVVLFPEAIIILDLKGIITRVNKQVLNIFGWETEQELINRNFAEFSSEEDKSTIQTAIARMVTDGSVSNVQYLALKKDGSMLRVSFSGSVFKDNQGNPQEIICVLHDITPHLSELEQVREAQRQLSEAQQIAHFGSWVWDIQTNKFHWTEEMFRLFGVTTLSEVNNDTLMAYIVEEDRDKVKSFIEQSLKEGKSSIDFRVMLPENEKTQWFHSRTKTFFDLDHKPLRMVGTVHDITHDKEIDQVKTQFLSMASHQMRGPLTTINWNAEMLLQQQAQGLTDSQRKYIQELYNASKRIVQLTNDLLTVSELELSRMPFKPETLSLEKIIKRVLEDFQHTITDKKITLKETYAEKLPDIQTDLFLLKTIFQQLIANAVNYTPAQGTISIGVSIDQTKKNMFLISISDTGYGIPKNEQEKVFSKMFRATNAKANVMGGTGLGLYIVKLIVKLNGGEIRFSSEENKGSTFTIELPFVPTNLSSAIKLP